MLFFPNAKINLGLRILRRRADGYHDIATIMLPVGWCDVLEMLPAHDGTGSFRQSGDALDCPPEKNLVLKALRNLEAYLGRTLPPLDIILEKHIPSGAGLGGGSSDASFALIGANAIFRLGLSAGELAEVAARTGADCPFFIYNRPMLATGIGEILRGADCSALAGTGLLIAKPVSEAVSTAAAYAGVTPREIDSESALTEELGRDVAGWADAGVLVNDFESSIFPLRPEIAAVKERMRTAGAVYTAMSGSGAAVFGLFPSVKLAEEARTAFADCDTFAGNALYTSAPSNVLPS